MRQEGFTVIGYIDDCLIVANSEEECVKATTRLRQLLLSLGFAINENKSVSTPSNEIVFLGYQINSLNLTISPTLKKKEKCAALTEKLLNYTKFKIRIVASAIGFIVDLCKGVEYGANYFRALERSKIRALRKVGKIGYEGTMRISNMAKAELRWWRRNIWKRNKKIRISPPEIVLTTDASLEGWGAVFQDQSSGGKWSCENKELHCLRIEGSSVRT